MPQIGPLEVLLVGVIALVVFGPQRLPDIARTIGRTLNEFRRQAAEIRDEFSSGLTDLDEVDDERAVPGHAPGPDGEPEGSLDGEGPAPEPDHPAAT